MNAFRYGGQSEQRDILQGANENTREKKARENADNQVDQSQGEISETKTIPNYFRRSFKNLSILLEWVAAFLDKLVNEVFEGALPATEKREKITYLKSWQRETPMQV